MQPKQWHKEWTVPPLIEVKHHTGRSSYVEVCGIDISYALKYFQMDAGSIDGKTKNNTVTATISIDQLLDVLLELTDEQIESAKETLRYYMQYRKEDKNFRW